MSPATIKLKASWVLFQEITQLPAVVCETFCSSLQGHKSRKPFYYRKALCLVSIWTMVRTACLGIKPPFLFILSFSTNLELFHYRLSQDIFVKHNINSINLRAFFCFSFVFFFFFSTHFWTLSSLLLHNT